MCGLPRPCSEEAGEEEVGLDPDSARRVSVGSRNSRAPPSREDSPEAWPPPSFLHLDIHMQPSDAGCPTLSTEAHTTAETTRRKNTCPVSPLATGHRRFGMLTCSLVSRCFEPRHAVTHDYGGAAWQSLGHAPGDECLCPKPILANFLASSLPPEDWLGTWRWRRREGEQKQGRHEDSSQQKCTRVKGAVLSLYLA